MLMIHLSFHIHFRIESTHGISYKADCNSAPCSYHPHLTPICQLLTINQQTNILTQIPSTRAPNSNPCTKHQRHLSSYCTSLSLTTTPRHPAHLKQTQSGLFTSGPPSTSPNPPCLPQLPDPKHAPGYCGAVDDLANQGPRGRMLVGRERARESDATREAGGCTQTSLLEGSCRDTVRV